MVRRRRVAVVTGSRAEYGLLRSPMRHIAAHPRLHLQLVATGMHLLRSFGYTLRHIKDDGFSIDKTVPMYRPGDDRLRTAEAIGRGVTGLSRALSSLDSDIVVILGDRAEALAAAVAATATGRTIAHLHGGDVAPGDLDDAYRHAITKLAHLHLVASDDAARRVVRLGESPRHVHVVGAPGLDELRIRRSPPEAWLSKQFGLDDAGGIAVVMYHPVGRAARTEGRVMRAALAAIRDADLGALVISPNNDAGHSGIIEAIESARRAWPARRLTVKASLPRDMFLDALRAARVVVGNSSCGMIEAHSAGTPAVNIGSRQRGRLRNRGSVIDCGETRQQILAGVQTALRRRIRDPQASVYGAGRAGNAVARIVSRITLSDNLRRKHISY